MNKKKKLIIASIVAVLLAALIVAVTLAAQGRSDKNNGADSDKTASKDQLNDDASASQKAMEQGNTAEKKGDTREALKQYKDALELCNEKDDACKASASNKVQLMDIILTGKKNKDLAPEAPKDAPVPIPSPTPTPPVPEAPTVPEGADKD